MITMLIIIIVLAKKNKKLKKEFDEIQYNNDRVLSLSCRASYYLQKQVDECKDLLDIYEKGFVNTSLSKDEMEEWINTLKESIEAYKCMSDAYLDALNKIEEV